VPIGKTRSQRLTFPYGGGPYQPPGRGPDEPKSACPDFFLWAETTFSSARRAVCVPGPIYLLLCRPDVIFLTRLGFVA
jgi:hypothetical protein